MNKVLVTFSHCRALGYCLDGVRLFCERHDLNYKDLNHKIGIPVEHFEATEDGLALRLAHYTRLCHEHQD